MWTHQNILLKFACWSLHIQNYCTCVQKRSNTSARLTFWTSWGTFDSEHCNIFVLPLKRLHSVLENVQKLTYHTFKYIFTIHLAWASRMNKVYEWVRKTNVFTLYVPSWWLAFLSIRLCCPLTVYLSHISTIAYVCRILYAMWRPQSKYPANLC